MSKVYFISDLHLGHKNICNFRKQFATPEEHDAFVKQKVEEKLTKRDTLYILGDVAFSAEAGDWIVELSQKIQKLVIVLGNHDTDRKDRKDNIVKWANAGIVLMSLGKYKGYWLSHAPIHEQELRGKKNIHGHVHGNRVMLDGEVDERYIDVSCESVDFEPKLLEELK